MNPDFTILCSRCHARVVRAENMQGQIVMLEPVQAAYVYGQRGLKVRAQRVDSVAIKHKCPAEKGK